MDNVREAGLSEREAEWLYGTARDLPPEERIAYVEAACEGKPEQRTEVLALLECAEPAEAFFSRLQEHILSISLSSENDGTVSGQEAHVPSAHDLPPGSTLARYRVKERIGSGGMGTVYRAHDPLLKRDVALKLLPHHLSTDPEARERFLQEARAAAALDHPNICTIHEVGETEDGRPFLAMARYEGETLKERLARGALPVEEAVVNVTQLARALAAAHSRGIVHRDVKPGNVMLLPDGTVKLLDFGLARMADVSLTRPGTTPGTVAYMSPEQVNGHKVDHRTDLFSLGVVLYEMLTGVRPFRGEGDRAVLNGILHEEPEVLRSLRPEVPESVTRIVARLLEKDPAARYDTAEDLLAELEGRAVRKRRRVRAIPVRRPARVLLGVVIVLVVPALFWMMQPRPPMLDPQRVVVAPFENRTGDPALDPVGSMAADWVTEGISHAAGVKVVPTGVALVSAGYVRSRVDAGARVDPIRALAEETGAALVVSGAYYRAGDSLQFHAQITDARQRRLLLALEPVAGELEAPAAAIHVLRQRTLAGLAPFLHPRFGETAHLYGTPPSYEAHRAYVDGMELYIHGRTRESIPHFERALGLDSAYLAPSWLLGSAYLILGERARADSMLRELERSRERLTPFQQATLGLRSAFLREDRVAAYEAARRIAEIAPQSLPHVQLAREAVWLNRPREAIQVLSEIDPTRGAVRGWRPYWRAATEAHHVLGNHRRELREARRARALFPEEPLYFALEARALAARGRVAELEALVAARALLPEDRWSTGMLMRTIGDELRIHGRPEEARQWYVRAISWYRGRPAGEQAGHRATVGAILVEAGRWVEARAIFRDLAAEEPDNLGVQGVLGIIAARLGDVTEAERLSGLLAAESQPDLGGAATFQRACIAAQLGRKAEAVALLREAFGQGYEHGWGPRHDPFLDPLRDYPPFRELMRPKG